MSDSFNDGGMSSLILQAAQSAAQADGLIAASNDRAQQQQVMARALQMQQQQQMQQAQQQQHNNNGGGGGKKKGPPLRRGKWTPEEEAYANRLIQEFKAGLLPLTDGTTLRTFLSKLLNCDPMRISKKFVGGNCIGKQVFRRRTADLNRLTPEQIQKSRAELSELERRFLERVAQTNRVKSSGVGAGAGAGGPNNSNVPMTVGGGGNSLGGSHDLQRMNQNNMGGASRQGHHEPPSPPWLQPPLGFKHGNGALLAASNLSGSSSRAAAAGRALLGGSLFQRNNDKQQQSNNDSRDLLAELQRRASQQSVLQTLQQQNQSSASNFLAAAVRSGNSGGLSAGGGSGLSMAQLAHSASAARLSSNPSVSDLMLKTGLSRDQLSQLARDRGGLSSGSLSSMLQGQRQNSFDALMSLDFQSLQSIDNLANLIQNGSMNHVPESGLRNAEFVASRTMGSSGDLMADRHLGSAGRVESFLRNFSNSNMGQNNASGNSNANLSSLLQSMGNLNQLGAGLGNGGGNASSGNLWASNAQSAASLANLLRQDSSTGLTALRVQDGLNSQRNSSVDDFLSLMAAGDIPHQDPSLLDIPLMQQQHGQDSAARLLAHQQLMQSNPALANALASRSLGNLSAAGGLSSNALAAAAGNKRKLGDVSGLLNAQDGNKD